MRVSVPLFVHSDRPHGNKAATYTVRPLLFEGQEFRNHNLGKATANCVGKLRKNMSKLCSAGHFQKMLGQTYSPDCRVHRLRLDIHLRSAFRRDTFVVVSFRALDRTIAFLPTHDELWFEVPKDQGLEQRARNVLTDFLLEHERDGADIDEWMSVLRSQGRTWVNTVEFDIEPLPRPKSLKKDFAAFLSPARVADGATELENVGRCLDVQYPDRLQRSAEREDLVQSLTAVLNHDDKRPVLVVGRRSVGKTSLIHEVVFRRRDVDQQVFGSEGNTWLLSPQRLIAGMSYVGQWENRLLAILNFAKKKQLVLYFDDLVGLYRAGVSRDSDLSIAQVLKPWVERRDVRLLGEITPEALRVLREQDRAFADMFHIVRVDEPDRQQTVRMLLSVVRELEKADCHFDPNAIQTVTDLCRRFSRNAAMPGAGADMLRNVASSASPHSPITRYGVIGDFAERSGLNRQFIDQKVRLQRENIVDGLRAGIVGQDAAVNAVADRICISRAGLNDTSRPLGSFLFAGPTGVGKTQCARALAEYLYGSADRMVRFDMNEFVTYYAAARLVGTFSSPEGLLTSAVRQQPFSVVLLDEIEKAHPDVFDLLLQVLGEGRLTDALGNTVDFGNTFVIMTSNLGSKEAAGIAGFGSSQPRTGAYLQAIERFFRPEFVNRLDRIVPFLPLDLEQIHSITRRLIEGVSQREGFQRRRCIMQPHPRVVDRIVKRGYEPKWGARGVRREIEQTVLQPIANQLATATHSTPTIVSLDASDEKIQVRVQPLQDAPRAENTIQDIDLHDSKGIVVATRAFLDRATDVCQAQRPHTELVAGSIDPDYYHYLNAVELIRELREACRRLTSKPPESEPNFGDTLVTRARTGRIKVWRSRSRADYNVRPILSEFAAADDIKRFMDDPGMGMTIDGEADLPRLVRAAAMLNLLLPTDGDWHDQRVLLLLRSLQTSGQKVLYVLKWQNALGQPVIADWTPGIECPDAVPDVLHGFPIIPTPMPLRNRLTDHNCNYWVLEGAHAATLMKMEEGIHLCAEGTRMLPYQVVTVPLGPEEKAEDVINRVLDQHNGALHHGGDDNANPFSLQPVVRMYHDGNTTLDLRTGIRGTLDLLPQMLSALPLPEELLEM